MNTATFTPHLPTITVAKIETADDLKEVGALLRDNRATFVGLPYTRKDIRVRKNNIYVPAENDAEPSITLAMIGTLLVTSTNGKLFLTDEAVVADGDFTVVPLELFKPVVGLNNTEER